MNGSDHSKRPCPALYSCAPIPQVTREMEILEIFA